jgi:hypothetical protein
MSEVTQSNTDTESKPTKSKAAKRPAKAKAAKPKTKAAKIAKAAKPRKEKPARESRDDWGTFALKMPIPEREAFHSASGAAGASRFARIVLNAFTNEDEIAFKNAIAEARKLR